MLYAVIIFGVIIVLQLWNISSILAANLHPLNRQAEQIRKFIEHELLWYRDGSFAHGLRKYLEEIPKPIVKELEWTKDYSFAQQLRQQIAIAAREITDQLQSHEDGSFAHGLSQELEELRATGTENAEKLESAVKGVEAAVERLEAK
jgi:hypothetical protein